MHICLCLGAKGDNLILPQHSCKKASSGVRVNTGTEETNPALQNTVPLSSPTTPTEKRKCKRYKQQGPANPKGQVAGSGVLAAVAPGPLRTSGSGGSWTPVRMAAYGEW